MSSGNGSDELSPAASVVLQALISNPLGLSKFELERRCQLNRLDVGRACRSLGQLGFATQTRSRWKATSLAQHRDSAPTDNTIRGSQAAVGPTATTVDAPEGWDVLRRLCEFYAECMRLEGASKIRIDLGDSQLNREIRSPIPWFKLAQGQTWTAGRSVLPEGGDGLGRRGRRAILAGPVELFSETDRQPACWRPVFLMPVTVQRDVSELHFSPAGELRVNVDWLNARIDPRDGDGQEELLIRLGLLRENDNFELEAIDQPNFETCWDTLRSTLPSAEWEEDRSPRDPSAFAPLQTINSPGIHARVLLLPEPTARFGSGAVAQDLEAIAKASDEELAGTALGALLGDLLPPELSAAAGAGEQSIQGQCFQVDPLNVGQARVVDLAMKESLTVVQGPPGTGKSTVVRNALVSVALQGGSAIFASRNHRAVEAVVPRLNAISEPESLVLHVNPQDDSGRGTSRPWTARILDGVRFADDENASESMSLHVAAAEAALRDSESLRGKLAKIFEGAHEIAEIGRELDRIRTHKGDEWCERADALPPSSIPATAHAWAETMLRDAIGPTKIYALIRLAILRVQINQAAVQARIQFPQQLTLKEIADLVSWQRLRLAGARLEEKLRNSRSFESIGVKLDKVQQTLLNEGRSAAELLPLVAPSRLSNGHAAFIHSLRTELHGGASGTGGSRLKNLLVENFDVVLGMFPLWACTNLSVPSNIPMAVGAFDLAIIDEAAQCDVPSVIPILFRAKRALIVGDPQQLNPIIQVSRRAEEGLRLRFGLSDSRFSRFSYCANSAYDVARGAAMSIGDDHVILREHYRCHPAIAGYFSRQFYDNSLEIRTNLDAAGTSSRGRGLKWTHVVGGHETIGSSRWHQPQAEAIVNELQELADEAFEGTVGVVTPFRPHADRIRDMAHAKLKQSVLKKWEFVSATADGFQGGEKDIILFGLIGGGDGPNPTPPFYGRNPNRFNVAVSRAKSLLHVFGDSAWAKECSLPVLEDLYRACTAETVTSKQSDFRKDLVGPVWEPLLAKTFDDAEIDHWQQYQACGFYLDFAIFPRDNGGVESTRKINIEVDGETYHRDRNGNLRQEDLYRDQILRAAGWTTKRFWVYELREDIEKCLGSVQDLIRTA